MRKSILIAAILVVLSGVASAYPGAGPVQDGTCSADAANWYLGQIPFCLYATSNSPPAVHASQLSTAAAAIVPRCYDGSLPVLGVCGDASTPAKVALVEGQCTSALWSIIGTSAGSGAGHWGEWNSGLIYKCANGSTATGTPPTITCPSSGASCSASCVTSAGTLSCPDASTPTAHPNPAAGTLIDQVANDVALDPALAIVSCARAGQTNSDWTDDTLGHSCNYTVCNWLLGQLGFTKNQVQAVIESNVNGAPDGTSTIPVYSGSGNHFACTQANKTSYQHCLSEAQHGNIVRQNRAYFGSQLTEFLLVDQTYDAFTQTAYSVGAAASETSCGSGGNTTQGCKNHWLSNFPWAFELFAAIKNLTASQISQENGGSADAIAGDLITGNQPKLMFLTSIWAPACVNGARLDGECANAADYRPDDYVHPAQGTSSYAGTLNPLAVGTTKIANMVLLALKTNTYTQGWVLAAASPIPTPTVTVTPTPTATATPPLTSGNAPMLLME